MPVPNVTLRAREHPCEYLFLLLSRQTCTVTIKAQILLMPCLATGSLGSSCGDNDARVQLADSLLPALPCALRGNWPVAAANEAIHAFNKLHAIAPFIHQNCRETNIATVETDNFALRAFAK